MTAKPLARMVNLSTGKVFGELNETQLGFLRKHLDQESESDTSFLFQAETAEWMREQGAEDLADLLQTELGGADVLPVGMSPLLQDAPGRVRGRLLDLKTQAPLPGYKIEALDHHMFSDRLLGWNYSDAQGRFEILFSEGALGHRRLSVHADIAPEVKLRINNSERTGTSTTVGTTTNNGSSSFPGIGSSQSAVESLVSRGGAPPMPTGEESPEATATPVGDGDDEELGGPASGDADETPADEVTEDEEAIVDSGEEVPEGAVVEGEVGSIAGMETEWGDIFIAGDGRLIAPALEGASAICPQCGSTFDQGISTCGDCRTALYPLS